MTYERVGGGWRIPSGSGVHTHIILSSSVNCEPANQLCTIPSIAKHLTGICALILIIILISPGEIGCTYARYGHEGYDEHMR